MTRSRLQLTNRAICALLLSCAVGGCQFSYRFEVSGVVRSAADGLPLGGVIISLKSAGLRDETLFEMVTRPDGTFSANFSVRDSAFHPDEFPKWTLELSREDYRDEKFDLTLRKRPNSPKDAVQIVVYPSMRAK
jgi:hypothetical protein